MTEPIKFWRAKGEKYGAFSNFSNHGFELDGHFWKTSEHYYQAQKFAGSTQTITINNKNTLVFDYIRDQKGPMGAAKEGRRRDFIIRQDWDWYSVKDLDGWSIDKPPLYRTKDIVMYRALRAKFKKHESIRNLLLSTGDLEIIEDSPTDYYWGCGKDVSGLNMLGRLLMKLREEFRNDKGKEGS